METAAAAVVDASLVAVAIVVVVVAVAAAAAVAVADAAVYAPFVAAAAPAGTTAVDSSP